MPTAPTSPNLPTSKRQIENHHYMLDAMRRLDYDMHHAIYAQHRIPSAWHTIATEPRDHEKTRVTMRVDKDVLRFFKTMGAGYQPKMNLVLRAFMHARLTGLVEGAETMDAYKWEHAAETTRPGWGDSQREIDDMLGGG